MSDKEYGEGSRKKKILVVEDDAAMGELLQLILDDEEIYDTRLIASPAEAFHIALLFFPDLFIIDYLLAGMTGIVLYDRLHAQPELMHIPAIITSASLYHHRQQIEERGLAGLEKPFELDELLEKIEDILRQ